MEKNTAALLKKMAVKATRPDGKEFMSLSYESEQTVASHTGLPLGNVQIEALRNNIIPERYSRNNDSLSPQDQIILLQAHVAVIGQGGLGGTVTEILARIGIGHLTLIDGDVFEESNLNRQLLSTMEKLGTSKAEAGKERAAAINPAIQVNSIDAFLTEENGKRLLAGVDLAIDCLDSITARFTLEEACRHHRIPLISAAIAGTTGQAMTIMPDDVGLRRIYGTPESAGQKGAETRLGTLPYTAIFMASIECAEAVRLLCKRPSSLDNSILFADIDNKTMEKMTFPNT